VKEEQNIHELIDQYLRGELLGEELDLIKIRLREDKKFLQQVQIQQAIIEEIGKMRDMQLRSIFTEEKKKKRVFIIPFNRRVLSVAAIVLSITALSMVLKMFLPSIQMAMEDEKAEELVATESDSLVEKVDIVEQPVDSLLEYITGLAEVVEEDKFVDTASTIPTEAQVPQEDVLLTETDDLTVLKNAEDQLDAKDIDAVKDELLSSIQITVTVFNMVAPAKAGEESTSISTATTEKSSKRKKRKEENKKAKSDDVASEVEVDKVIPVLERSTGKTITVEYWKSIVNFSGYHYDGSVLMLYELPDRTPVQVITYDNKSYVKWDGNVYNIVANKKYESFSKVTDQEVLKVISK
jgi:hypothetical protein